MLKIFIKHLMGCHRIRVLSLIVAILHLVWSLREIYYTYLDFLDYYSAEDLKVEKDEIFDMPLPAVQYMIVLFILVLVTTVLLFIGIILKRPLCIASFMLAISIFMVTFLIFGLSEIAEGLLAGEDVGKIFREFMDDISLIVADFLLLYPVFLLFVDLTEPLDDDDPPISNVIKIVKQVNNIQEDAV